MNQSIKTLIAALEERRKYRVRGESMRKLGNLVGGSRLKTRFEEDLIRRHQRKLEIVRVKSSYKKSTHPEIEENE